MKKRGGGWFSSIIGYLRPAPAEVLVEKQKANTNETVTATPLVQKNPDATASTGEAADGQRPTMIGAGIRRATKGTRRRRRKTRRR